jgi:DNA modification methylase
MRLVKRATVMAKKKPHPRQPTFESLRSRRTIPEGYYSGDKPNPNLRRFVEVHATAYDPEADDYSVPAFNRPIETTKATAIYNMHSYHQGKKPHDAIRQYIRHYTKPGELVLDPFSGSGSTALAAILERRKAIAIDRSPAATFITKNYCTPVDPAELEAAFRRLRTSLASEIEWLYATKCDHCDGPAIIEYTLYSQVFQCPRCLKRFPLFDCAKAEGQTHAGKAKKVNACPYCLEKGHAEVIRSQGEKFGAVSVLTSYRCLNACRSKSQVRQHNDSDRKKRLNFEKYDLEKINEIEAASIPYEYPKGYDMTGFSRYQRDALFYYGVREIADLFTKRNRWAIAAFVSKARTISEPELRDVCLFGITAIILAMSRMQGHVDDPRFPNQLLRGTYYISHIGREYNVADWLDGKVRNLVAGYNKIVQSEPGRCVMISTQSSTDLSSIPSNSIDYVLIDPAYAESVQYGELNFAWEAWLGLDTKWHEEEIVVNDVRGLAEMDWSDRILKVMKECYRVLKPGRWVSLCYHDTSEGTWQLVQDIVAEAGFVADKNDSALFIDTSQKSRNQLTADKTTKRDLVLNLRKPKLGEWRVARLFISANVDIATFNELARQVIRDFLNTQPGSTKDRIYDALVSCMVRKGQMEAHDFDALLMSVAEEVQQPVKQNLFENKEPDLFGSHVESRWYLKETADQMDQAEQAKEDAAAARLSKFMGAYLKKHPELEGVHFSDLIEQVYFFPEECRTRRQFQDWLPEYFIKTPSGSWLLPDKEEAMQLAKLREAGTLRRIKRFANALIDGVPVREKDRPGSDVNLLDWLRQCRRAGLYEQGRAIYEKGGLNLADLADEQQIEAEDDYRICARRGSDEVAKPKKQRRTIREGDE